MSTKYEMAAPTRASGLAPVKQGDRRRGERLNDDAFATLIMLPRVADSRNEGVPWHRWRLPGERSAQR